MPPLGALAQDYSARRHVGEVKFGIWKPGRVHGGSTSWDHGSPDVGRARN